MIEEKYKLLEMVDDTSQKAQYIKDKADLEEDRKRYIAQLTELRKDRDFLQHTMKQIGCTVSELETHYPPLSKESASTMEEETLSSLKAITSYISSNHQTTISVGKYLLLLTRIFIVFIVFLQIKQYYLSRIIMGFFK